MNSFVLRRRSFVAMLLVYCCLSATLPLSNIHIENIREGYGYVCVPEHPEGDIHILLHELLSSHFNNKSDHIRNISSVQQIKHKTEENKGHLQPALAIDITDVAVCLDSQRLAMYYDKCHIKPCQYFSVSGLSPPSA